MKELPFGVIHTVKTNSEKPTSNSLLHFFYSPPPEPPPPSPRPLSDILTPTCLHRGTGRDRDPRKRGRGGGVGMAGLEGEEVYM